MDTCFKCGIPEEKALLYDVITSEGVQKVCRKCSFKEELPMIENKDASELKEFERKKEIYDRISRVSRTGNFRKLNQKNMDLEEQNSNLRDLVEKNICKGVNKIAKPRNDLVRNFHWIIKRYRRLKKLSVKQFAEELKEAEKTIELAEQGVVPEGYDLIRKIETFLGVTLIHDDVYEEILKKEQQFGKRVTFDRYIVKNLTIADLKESEKQKGSVRLGEIETKTQTSEEEFLKPDFDISESKKQKSKKELSQDDIEDLIFGGKQNSE